MQKRDLLKLSTRMFKARTGRTVLTILGMGIGIGAILFLVGLGYGLQEVLLKTITTSDSLLALDVSADKEKGSKLNSEAVRNIESQDGVADIVPIHDVQVQIKIEDISADGAAVVSKPALLKLEGKKIIAGSDNFEENPNEIVISSAFSNLLNLPPEDLKGKSVNFSLFLPSGENTGEAASEKLERKTVDSAYKIGGVIENEELSFYVSGAGLEHLFSKIEYSRLKVKCRSSDVLDGVKEKLIGNNFLVSSLSDTVKEVNKMFRVVKIILALFGLVALLVSAIGMFNTMTVSLLERTKEIGIMKSIGASDKDILFIFLIESTIMGFLGGLSGIVLGIFFGKSANLILNTVARKMGGQALSLFYFPAWFLLFIIGFSILIGFLTGLVPARRASVIDPLDALRSK
ncbi:MAG: cell division protein FtsX [Candidatus Moranbacteria bacterium GW2011_GWC1_45_18]|nr:MAG: hypothetical protein UT79_C0007G0003 [Candidatus Moranbacteria bacterium GW2011_GWC2_40_12]KKT70398.1 MAG: hypothetical protein UW66_C0042G0004 [Candidatus Moranbacteria bacterium GW2011_GWF1_44_4]KKT99004.1 MAG: cell division protein FtsX [Candidatus Moranbacteria bacterium GW2011_GWC1_45_18]OGI35788.1 MAG: hypothetical protein A2407_05005 [Candidatus Moranbacteria bacterium RIFOXYC1_FULL_44_8]HBB36916.1 hypothetical protein [Candidatus Moranbacteria bacterium]